MRPMSRVNSPACRPYRLALQVSITSPKPSYGSTATSAPNTSRVTTAAVAGGCATTVGATVAPSRVPPSTTSAPSAAASAAQRTTRSAASLVDHRPDVGRLVQRVAGAQLRHLGGERVQELAEPVPLHVDPLDRDAALAGVAVPGARAHPGGGGDVRVLADDRGRVAAQLEHQALAPGGARHRVAGGRAAGEADHRDLVRRAQPGADLAVPVQQLHRLGGIPASSSSSTTAAELAGACGGALTIVRVPGGERRAELVREQVRRGVERRDGQRHPRGRPVGQRGVPDAAVPARHRQQLTADPARLGRADRQGVGDPVDLAAAVLDRLAELEGEQGGQLGRAVPPPAGRPGPGPARAAGASRATAGRRVPRVAGRPPDVVRAGLRRAADHAPQVRAGPLAPTGRRAPLARDQRGRGGDFLGDHQMVHLTVQLNRSTDCV